MRFRASGPIVHRVAPVLVLLLLGSLAAAQTPKKGDYLSNVDLCNGSDRMSLSGRINGCTALIASSQGTTALAIAYNNRGNAYTANGDFDRAIPDFDQSIKLDPTNAKPFSNRGAAYLRKGEYDLALKSLDQAIKLNPKYGRAFVNRAGIYLKKHEYDRAARDYDEAIRLEPSLEAAWSGRCWTRAVLGSLQAALEDCNKVLQSWPNDAATYDFAWTDPPEDGTSRRCDRRFQFGAAGGSEAGECALWARACQAQKRRQGRRRCRYLRGKIHPGRYR